MQPVCFIFSSNRFFISIACLAIRFSIPLYLTQLSKTSFISTMYSYTLLQTLNVSFFFIVPKSMGCSIMSKQSSIPNLLGSTGQWKQYPPFDFQQIVSTFCATFTHASFDFISSMLVVSIYYVFLSSYYKSGQFCSSYWYSINDTSFALPKLSDLYSRYMDLTGTLLTGFPYLFLDFLATSRSSTLLSCLESVCIFF